MATQNAYLDENSVPTLIAASNANGTDIVRIKVSDSTHGLIIDDNTTGSDNGNNQGNAMRDQNSRPVLIAVSSVDGFSPVEVYGDPATGALLVDSL